MATTTSEQWAGKQGRGDEQSGNGPGPGGSAYKWIALSNTTLAMIMATIDGSIVRRSAAAVDRYGPDFTYGHHLVARRLATVGGMAAAVGAVAVLAPIPPTRKLLLKAKSPGEGPSEATRAGSWFKIRFVGEGGGKRVVTEVSGGDPGYSETSKILAECGLCLAFDDLPDRAGQLTTVASMGDMLLTRLQSAGIAFEVLETA